MRTLIAAAVVAAGLAGCLLAEEDCGDGFGFDGVRCVPLGDPSPPRDPGAGGQDPGASADAGPTVDMEPPSIWAEYRVVLLIDRTRPADASRTPASPGADIDAVQIVEATPIGERPVGVAIQAAGFVLDPFDGNLNTDLERVLGPPDGRAVSMGTDGGYMYVSLDLERPLRSADLIVITEVTEVGADADRYQVYLCREPDDSLQDCRLLDVAGGGLARIPLP